MVRLTVGEKEKTVAAIGFRRKATHTAITLALAASASSAIAAGTNVAAAQNYQSTSTSGQTVQFNADGTLSLGTGAVITFVSGLNSMTAAQRDTGVGTLHFEGSATVASSVGTYASVNGQLTEIDATTAAPLKLITGGATVSGSGTTVTFASTLNAVAATVSGIGTLAFNGITTVTNLTFAGNGTASFASTATINGLVTTNTGSTGTLSFAGANATFASRVGTSSAGLKTASITTGVATFSDALYVDTLNFAGDGTVSVASGTIGTVTVTGTNSASQGDLKLTGNTTVSGAIGSSASRLRVLSTFGGTTTFSGAVYATNVTALGTTTFSGAVSATTVSTLGTTTFGSTLSATTVSLGGTTTFTGALTATSASLNNVTLNGGATVTNATILKGATVTVAAGQSLTGTVNAEGTTGAGVTTGSITYLGSTTISNSIGATNSLTSIQFQGSGTANVNASLYAANVSLTGTSTVNIGARTNSNSYANWLVGGGNTLNFGSGAYSTSVSSLKVDAGGTISTTVVSSSVAFGGGTGESSYYAYTSSMQTANKNYISSNANYYINVPGNVTLVSGTYLRLVAGTSGKGGVASSTNVTSNSNALTFTVVATAVNVATSLSANGIADDLWVLVTKQAGSLAAAGGGASSPIGGALSAIGAACLTATCSASALAVNNYLEGLNMRTEAGLAEATKVAATGVSVAAAVTAANGAAAAGLNSVASRLASIRGDTILAESNSVGTGIAGGDRGRDSAFWAKANGLTGRQESYDGFAGYDVGQSGLAFGYDTDIGDMRLGGAYTYSDSGISMRNRESGSRTNIKTNQLALYGTKEFGEIYVDAMLGYAMNKFTGSRAALQGSTGSSSYSGSQWTARVGGGYRIAMGGGTTLTPIAAIEYAASSIDGYTETGVVVNGTAANNSYNSVSTSGIKTSLGVQYSGSSDWSGMAIKPEVHAVWTHDFGDEKKDVTGLLAGSVAFTAVGQKRALDSYTLGGGIAFLPNKTSKITVTYDYDTRKSYAGHAVNVTGRWNF